MTASRGPHLLMPSSLITVLRPHSPADIDLPNAVDDGDQRDLLHALAACAVLAGAATFAAIAHWAADLDPPARGRLGFAGPIPVGSTVWRFLIRLDAQVLPAVLTGWLRARITTPPAGPPQRRCRVVIAVDGKVLRGTRLPGGRQVHLLWAYDSATGIVLAQPSIATKSTEIPAFTPLLDQIQAMLGPAPG